MGDFNTVATMLRRLALRPTAQQQREARRAGLQPVVVAARAQLASNGSNKTYKLSQSLGIATKDALTSSAGPIRGKKHASVGHLVEFGTAPHWQPNRFGGTMHPGARPKPFMRPAYDMSKAQIVLRAGESLVQAIFRG